MAKRARFAVPSFTVSADVIRGLIDCAEKCGLPRARLADLLVQEKDGPPPARYGGEVVLKLWDRVQGLSNDPVIGFRMALAAGPKTFGVMGEVSRRCATLFDAYKQAERYSALASQGARISVACDARTLGMSLAVAAAGTPVHANIMFFLLMNMSLMPKRYTGVDVRPKLIACDFASPGAAAVRPLKEYCPFRFDAAQSRIAFDRSVGDLAIPSADADLRKLLTEVMERHLAGLGPAGSFEQGLMAILREMMDGTMPTLASLSARAGLSQRTLQRRLGEAETSFRELLQQVLQDQAEKLLARGNLTQGEIAFLLGYSEVSAFSRAYRGWTGHPPGAASA